MQIESLSNYFIISLVFCTGSSKSNVEGAKDTPAIFNPSALNDNSLVSLSTKIRDRRSTFCIPVIQDNSTFYTRELVYNWTDEHWIELRNDSKHRTLSNSTGANLRVNLTSSFPFYGHDINHVYVTTAGLLSMSPDLDNISPTHFIAPYMAHFNPHLWNGSSLHFKTTEDSFIVEWRNMFERRKNVNQPLQFQVIIYSNGTIIFLYKKLPSNIALSSVMVGFHSGIDTDIAGIKTKVFHKGEKVDPAHIHSGMGVIFTPVSDDVMSNVSETCVSQNVSFYCTCCEITRRCSNKTYKLLREWMNSHCIIQANSNCKTISQAKGGSSISTGILIGSIVGAVTVLILVVCGWIYYAYTHPLSPSGKWLIDHYPRYLWAKYRAKVVETRLSESLSSSASSLAHTDY